VIVEDRSDQFRFNLVNIIEARLEDAGDIIREELQFQLGRDWPPSSVPGEFPARRTGNLQRSVDIELDGDDTRMEVSVGPEIEYAEDLRETGRLMAPEAFEMVRDEVISKILNG
jgi:hypothetical protein